MTSTDPRTAGWDKLVDAATWEGVTVPGFGSPRAVIADIQRWLSVADTGQLDILRFTPALVRATYRTYGIRARLVLAAYAAGASEEFVTAYLSRRDHAAVVHVQQAWHQTRTGSAGVTEHEAVGWAHTDLYRPDTPDPAITSWTKALGPAAYLWVLAGYNLDEAVAMRDAGTPVTDQQLRVMVALAGTTLPAGI
ncbi:MAG: hypothetical protein ACOH1Y_18355 [Propionicimonas sp.]